MRTFQGFWWLDNARERRELRREFQINLECVMPGHLIQVPLLVIKMAPVEESPYLSICTGPARHHLQRVRQPGRRKTPDTFLPQGTATVLLAVLLALPEQRSRFHPGGLYCLQRHAI